MTPDWPQGWWRFSCDPGGCRIGFPAIRQCRILAEHPARQLPFFRELTEMFAGGGGPSQCTCPLLDRRDPTTQKGSPTPYPCFGRLGMAEDSPVSRWDHIRAREITRHEFRSDTAKQYSSTSDLQACAGQPGGPFHRRAAGHGRHLRPGRPRRHGADRCCGLVRRHSVRRRHPCQRERPHPSLTPAVTHGLQGQRPRARHSNRRARGRCTYGRTRAGRCPGRTGATARARNLPPPYGSHSLTVRAG